MAANPTGAAEVRPDPGSARTARWIFAGAGLALLVISAAVTLGLCSAMSRMQGMSMPGGWTMSMMWMRMPGQSWPGATASFLGTWVAMMVAMMLPSLLPALWRYRQAVFRAGRTRAGQWAALAGLAYFLVWALLGLAVFPLGVMLAAIATREPALARAVPLASGLVVVLAGVLQFSAWKARHLACCRATPNPAQSLPDGVAAAWRHGLRLGTHCARCCAGMTATLLAIGCMDLRVMATVAAAMTVERLAPAGKGGAQAIGVVAVGAGTILVVRAIALG